MVKAGAREAWLVYPETGHREIYTPEGRAETSAFAVALDGLGEVPSPQGS